MMNRRHFTRLTSSGAAGAWFTGITPRKLAATRPHTRLEQDFAANPQRLIERIRTLARFGANDAGGIDRVAFSDANIEALEWSTGHLREAGFFVERDLVGNLVARKAGSDASLNPIMFGSHIDSVPGGGNYDGQVGSVGAMEVAAVLADAGHTTRHPLEIMYFANEEGGKTGSRALVGEEAAGGQHQQQ